MDESTYDYSKADERTKRFLLACGGNRPDEVEELIVWVCDEARLLGMRWASGLGNHCQVVEVLLRHGVSARILYQRWHALDRNTQRVVLLNTPMEPDPPLMIKEPAPQEDFFPDDKNGILRG